MTDAKEYGKALFLLAQETDSAEDIARDVEAARTVISENPDYVRILDTPALAKEERVALVSESLSTLNEYVQNLVKIMAEDHRAHLFCSAADEYMALYDSARGIIRVEAISAVPMSAAQSEAIQKKLSDMLGGHAVITNTIDPSILGGMKLRYGAYQLDGSVRTRLDKFERSLKNTII